MNVDDVMLCRIYGELARAHYSEQREKCEARLREGWLRVRGHSRMEWTKPSLLIHKCWDQQAQLVRRRDR